MTPVAVFTGARSDLGPLGPVISGLVRCRELHLTVLAAVGHRDEQLRDELDQLGAGDAAVELLIGPPPSDEPGAIAGHGAQLHGAVAAALVRLRPRVLVVLGDRWELLSVVPAAVLLQVPVVHLHGGEVTEGALDERVRHAVTKLADEHCVATEDAARRVEQLGEPPARVHVTGAPGLDRLAAAEPLSPTEFEALLGVPLRRPAVLVTYHPPTAVADAAVRDWAAAVLDETAAAAAAVVATAPGLDPGHDEVRAALRDAVARYPHLVLVENLGRHYPRALATVDAVVGNSSSGIIEAASFRLPVLDVGERQQGRLRGANVVSVAEGRAAVTAGLRTVLDPAFRRSLAGLVNPYGNGRAADRIVHVVQRSTSSPSSAKQFHDHPVRR